MQAYPACITFADAMIGRLLAALDKSPHRDNTIVALWSDHEYLYDKQQDPNEWINPAGRPEMAARKKELSAWLPKTDASRVTESERLYL